MKALPVSCLLFVAATGACKRSTAEGAAVESVPLPVPGNRGHVVPILRGVDSSSAPVDAPNRVENIRSARIAARFDGGPIPEEALPITDWFVGDLLIRYAIDGERAMTDVSPLILQKLGLKREELMATGIANLHQLYPGAVIERGEGIGMVTQSGDLESSWMLDRAFWAQEAKKVKGDLVVSVPARDIMVWVDTAAPEKLEEIRDKGLQVYASSVASNRALSKLLYVWRDGHWEVFAPPK